MLFVVPDLRTSCFCSWQGPLIFSSFDKLAPIMMDHNPPPTMRYTANFSYPADQMPCLGNRNRSRTDSGTSSSSYSSSGSGKPPRRRSHRPRGCRGGSSRRSRNNSVDEKNGSTQKNGNNSSQKYQRNKNSSKPSSSDFNRVSNKLKHDKTPSILTKKPQSHHNKDRHWHGSRSSSVEAQYQQQQQSHHRSSAPYTESSFAHRSNQPPGFNGSHLDCKNGMMPPTNGGYYPSSRDTITDYSVNYVGNDSPSYYQDYSSSWDFPALQPSYSDSSSEALFMENQPPTYYPFPDSSSNHNFNNDYANPNNNTLHGGQQNQILPPMPVSKDVAPNDRPISNGPNPYALKLNTHVEGISSAHQPPKVTNHEDTTMFQEKTNHMSVNTSNVGTVGGGEAGAKNDSYHCEQGVAFNPYKPQTKQPSHDYRAERIERQRQTVEGGSLFVTSPRSFLMGWRKPTMTAA